MNIYDFILIFLFTLDKKNYYIIIALKSYIYGADKWKKHYL